MPQPTSLLTYSDPFLVKDGQVWVLRHTAKDLCSAPLLADPPLTFDPDELEEVYETGLIDQEEIDAIIRALTPAPPDDGGEVEEEVADEGDSTR